MNSDSDIDGDKESFGYSADTDHKINGKEKPTRLLTSLFFQLLIIIVSIRKHLCFIGRPIYRRIFKIILLNTFNNHL